jgi:hypothetical protein
MPTDAPARVPTLARIWLTQQRLYLVLAAVLGAVLGAVAVLVAQAVFSTLQYHTDGYQRSAYNEGYRMGKEWRSYFTEIECSTAARGRYQGLRSGPLLPGFGAYERGCNAAIEGRPADPEPPAD